MKPSYKTAIRRLLNLAIVAGVAMALWPAGQTAYGWWSQRSLQQAWQQEAKRQSGTGSNSSRKAKPAANRQATTTRAKNSNATVRKVSARPSRDWPLTRLIIPEIGVDVVVVDGDDEDSLKKGPGFVAGSALPGSGNCVIAGHRNIYGSWLYRVNDLFPDSIIKLRTPRETFTYLVASITEVSEADTSVLQPPATDGTPVLTLITCTLPHTPNRIVVSAYLDTEPTA